MVFPDSQGNERSPESQQSSGNNQWLLLLLLLLLVFFQVSTIQSLLSSMFSMYFDSEVVLSQVIPIGVVVIRFCRTLDGVEDSVTLKTEEFNDVMQEQTQTLQHHFP